VIPAETGGPFPGDGSNGPNVRPLSGVVRQDIRSSIDGSTGTADGLVLEIELTINDSAAGCVPRAGSAVYLWHCDQDGKYSMYDIPEQNYLRGIAEADANGIVKFTTIVPGCYAGRWPHIHFEVFESLADAVGTAQPWATSQLAFPADVLAEAYSAAGYETSVQNLGGVSLSGDNVFGDDGGIHQLATMSGNPSEGYTATLTVNA
jgi:protocatechuate 3,4-dioxygenase beta subunit